MLDKIFETFNVDCISSYWNCISTPSKESYVDLFKRCAAEAEDNNCPATSLIPNITVAVATIGLVSLVGVVTAKCFFKKNKSAEQIKREKTAEFTDTDKSKYHSDLLEKSLIHLYRMRTKILAKMNHKDIWKDQEFKSQFSAYLNESYKVTEILFEELKRVSAKYPLKKNNQQELMTELLVHQWKKEKDPLFIYAFFEFAYYYNLARLGAYKEDGKDKYPVLSETDQNPYFDENAVEFRWRAMFNSFHKNFISLGIADLVKEKDERVFYYAAFEDNQKLKFTGHAPFGIPTLLVYWNHLRKK